MISPVGDTPIPHICHFFYTDRIFENQILHPKKRLKAPKTLKMSLKNSNIWIFFTQSGKIYTWQKIFTQTCLWCLWQIWGMSSPNWIEYSCSRWRAWETSMAATVRPADSCSRFLEKGESENWRFKKFALDITVLMMKSFYSTKQLHSLRLCLRNIPTFPQDEDLYYCA